MHLLLRKNRVVTLQKKHCIRFVGGMNYFTLRYVTVRCVTLRVQCEFIGEWKRTLACMCRTAHMAIIICIRNSNTMMRKMRTKAALVGISDRTVLCSTSCLGGRIHVNEKGMNI